RAACGRRRTARRGRGGGAPPAGGPALRRGAESPRRPRRAGRRRPMSGRRPARGLRPRPHGGGDVDVRSRVAAELEEARRRTEELLAPVGEDDLLAQQDPLQSPLLWDYGHVGVFEELWLVSNLAGVAPR